MEDAGFSRKNLTKALDSTSFQVGSLQLFVTRYTKDPYSSMLYFCT